MARANRHYIPGTAWHITHRCHKKEFLLKFAKDRQRLVYWLFEAMKRYPPPHISPIQFAPNKMPQFIFNG